jgi:hypothetical protein
MLREVLLSRVRGGGLSSAGFDANGSADPRTRTILFVNRKKGGEENGRAEDQGERL